MLTNEPTCFSGLIFIDLWMSAEVYGVGVYNYLSLFPQNLIFDFRSRGLCLCRLVLQFFLVFECPFLEEEVV